MIYYYQIIKINVYLKFICDCVIWVESFMEQLKCEHTVTTEVIFRSSGGQDDCFQRSLHSSLLTCRWAHEYKSLARPVASSSVRSSRLTSGNKYRRPNRMTLPMWCSMSEESKQPRLILDVWLTTAYEKMEDWSLGLGSEYGGNSGLLHLVG